MSFVFGLTFTTLSLMCLHWFPYHRRLHVTGNYTLGTLAIFAGLTIWLWGDPMLDQLWAFPIVSGAAVLFCYLIDYVLNLRVRAVLNESEYHRVSETAQD